MLYPNSPEGEHDLFRDGIGAMLQEIDRDLFGIEIGVLNGSTSGFLLNLDERIHLTGVDPIIPDSMEASLIGSVEAIKKRTDKFGARFVFIEDYSQNVVDQFEESSLDFIFIDGSHHYEDVARDLELYYPKMREGAMIFFHDSRMNRGGAPFHPGPSKFIDELHEKGIMQLYGEAFSLSAFRKVLKKHDF